MSKFDASTVVEALEYDFRPHSKAHGTIPEPSDEQISAFLTGMKKLISDAGEQTNVDTSTMTPEQFMTALDQVDGEKIISIFQQQAQLFTALCSGKPSYDEIMQLPQRIRIRFCNWVAGEVMNPEAGAPAGSNQKTTLRSVASV